MRLGFNARYLQKEFTGIARYALRLVLTLPEVEPVHDYHLFFARQPFRHPEVQAQLWNAPHLRRRISRFPGTHVVGRLLWEHFLLALEARAAQVEVLHGLSHVLPLIKTARLVVTVHDVAYLLHPESYDWPSRAYFRPMITKAARLADAVITVSEAAKQEIVEQLKAPASKVHAIPHGVEPRFRPDYSPQELEQVRRKYGIPGPFIFHVSDMAPRKNLPLVAQAFRQLIDRGNRDTFWVVAGEPVPLADIFPAVEELNLQDRVIFTGRVPDEDLALLYGAATLFVFPSLHEGFGMPILEAMASGCPVLAAHTSSLPEVVGEAGLLLPPHDPEAWAAALSSVLSDLSFREHLREAGLQWASRFTWAEAARKTLEVYRKVLALSEEP